MFQFGQIRGCGRVRHAAAPSRLLRSAGVAQRLPPLHNREGSGVQRLLVLRGRGQSDEKCEVAEASP
jgi:hypothetical protein